MPKPKGAPKTGGRKAGVPNRKTAEMQRAVEESGITPLEFMLDMMRNSTDDAIRFEAAKAAAPYIHARLSAVEATVGNPDGTPLDMNLNVKLVKSGC